MNFLTNAGRSIALLCLGPAYVTSHAIFFEQGPLRRFEAPGIRYEAASIIPVRNFAFRVFATSFETPRRTHALQNEYQSIVTFGSAPSQTWSSFGAASESLDTYVYMTQHDPGSGIAYVTPVGEHRFPPPTSLSDAAGPVVSLPNAVSSDGTGLGQMLFEVRSVVGARKVIIVSYQPGVVNHRRYYELLPGEAVIAVAPRLEGGLLFLTGSPSSASLNYVDAAGMRFGPSFIGEASQVAYSSVNAGTVFTAGVGPSGNMHFTRGPVSGARTDSALIPFPFSSSSFEFRCVSPMDDGTCWWGGSYTKPGLDRNGFITAMRNNPGFDNFGSQTTLGESFDESVRAIAATPRGFGMWAGDGQTGFFSTTDGSTFARYPPTPDANLEFRAVAPYHKPYPTAQAYSFFGAVAYNASTQSSIIVKASMRGELFRAFPALGTMVGGPTVTVYAQMYAGGPSPWNFPVSSNTSAATPPASITFPGINNITNFLVTTQPVAAPKSVEITVGNVRPVVARFTLLPPTPYFFTPANQTIVGGATVTTRLSLNGKAPTGGLPVTLATSGAELTIPANVVVPAGLYSRSFVIRSAPVGATVTRTITATYASVSRTTDITLTP